MMSTPLVTIITPTYNHEKYIRECIASVQDQTFSEWEMIIINDGSTDKTYDAAQQMAKTDSRIKVINQQNVGVFRLGETYNKGLSLANGLYIAILEGDDTWESSKLQKQVIFLEQNPDIVMAWGRAQMVNEDLSVVYDTRPSFISLYATLYDNNPPGSILELLTKGSFIPALTVMIRKEKLIEIGGFIQSNGLPLVDFTTELCLSLLGKFHFENEVLGQWRTYPTQTTKTHSVQMHLGFVAFLKEHLPRVKVFDAAQKKHVLNYYKMMGVAAYARSGRFKLIRKEYKSARKDYAKAIMYPIWGEWLWRLRAVIGYVMSLFHLDVEWIARLLGKRAYGVK